MPCICFLALSYALDLRLHLVCCLLQICVAYLLSILLMFLYSCFWCSQNLDGRKASEYTSQSLPIGRKSHDAAVGVLVQMLRTAPPLRQDSSCYSSQSVKPEHEGGVATASGFFMPRKTSDALEELRSYKEMKDLLLSKSGMRVLAKEEA